MVVSCQEVWREISNYVDGDIDPALKSAMDEHFAECRNCRVVRDGLRNVVQIYGDERLFTLPPGIHARLRHRLAGRIEAPRGTARGWAISLVASGAIAALVLFGVVHDRGEPQLRAPMSQEGRRAPERLVAIVEGGKLFHAPTCGVIHGKYTMVPIEEAIREGYTPCTRCMKDLLRSADNSEPGLASGEEEAAKE